MSKKSCPNYWVIYNIKCVKTFGTYSKDNIFSNDVYFLVLITIHISNALQLATYQSFKINCYVSRFSADTFVGINEDPSRVLGKSCYRWICFNSFNSCKDKFKNRWINCGWAPVIVSVLFIFVVIIVFLFITRAKNKNQ